MCICIYVYMWSWRGVGLLLTNRCLSGLGKVLHTHVFAAEIMARSGPPTARHARLWRKKNGKNMKKKSGNPAEFPSFSRVWECAFFLSGFCSNLISCFGFSRQLYQSFDNLLVFLHGTPWSRLSQKRQDLDYETQWKRMETLAVCRRENTNFQKTLSNGTPVPKLLNIFGWWFTVPMER